MCSVPNMDDDILSSKMKYDNKDRVNVNIGDVPGTDNGYPEIPIEDYRIQYRKEVTVLWREVEDFKIMCQKEIARHKILLERYKVDNEKIVNGVHANDSAPDVTHRHDYVADLHDLDANMVSIERNQKILDEEQSLDEREESLLKRQEKLKQYEQDVEEAEMLLEKRQTIVRRRSDIVDNLNDDLLTMKQELRENIETTETQLHLAEDDLFDKTDSYSVITAATNSPKTSNKARRNWQLARRHLVDKVTLLETTVSRYRAQVASSSATITAKDMTIARLQKDNEELRNAIEHKEKRLKHLESQLSLTIEDKTRSDRKLDMLLEELQTIDLNTTAKVLANAERGAPKVESPKKRKVLKKQLSTFSFFTKSDQQTNKGGDSSKLPQRTSSDKSLTRLVYSEHQNIGESGEKETSNNLNIRKRQSLNASDPNLGLSLDDIGSKACIVM